VLLTLGQQSNESNIAVANVLASALRNDPVAAASAAPTAVIATSLVRFNFSRNSIEGESAAKVGNNLSFTTSTFDHNKTMGQLVRDCSKAPGNLVFQLPRAVTDALSAKTSFIKVQIGSTTPVWSEPYEQVKSFTVARILEGLNAKENTISLAFSIEKEPTLDSGYSCDSFM
jgi:hypothetical protein